MPTLKELSAREDPLTGGHTLCPGCAIPVALKLVLRATKSPLVVSNAGGCLQSATATYPRTSWKLNWLHTSAGTAASTMSGITAMYRSLKKQGKLPANKEPKFLVVAGDGATYDTGFSAVSGAMERGDDMVYLCYDNQLSAVTGGQASSSTPMGAATTTTPSGEVLPGKLRFGKNISRIIAAHRIPYVAQSAPWIWQDLYKKAERAFEVPGPAYLNVLTPCPDEWKTPTHISIQLTKLAADTCVWPIFEIRHGDQVTVNYKPKQKLPVTEWFKSQARFKHLLTQENKWIVEKIQEEVDKNWDILLSSQKDDKIREH
ncbi:MAG: pyruvate ferredoxin oxidoreductase [bacterium]|nr:pyruvate ferredoxin oxidoreductase [bacterium]